MSTTNPVLSVAITIAVSAACASAAAQTPPKQVVKPPIAQAWIDVATFSGMSGNPMSGGAAMGSAFGSLMGGRTATAPAPKAHFGQTTTGPDGRFVDVTVLTRRNPALAEAQQTVPEGFKLGPTLKLLPEHTAQPPKDEDPVLETEIPKARFILYWGCSETVRPGQPKVIELGAAMSAEHAQYFQSRRATKRGAHQGAGRPNWPNKTDDRGVPADASLQGQHGFIGTGIPDSFKFEIAAAQDLMPAMRLRQTDTGKAIILEWDAIPHARGYALASMAPLEDEKTSTMVLWSSSELPDTGLGLIDYQTNAAVDGWIKEKVVLPASTTRCAVPKEALGMGFVRAIAYGTEVNLVHPPRPADPNIAWEPDWNVKVRVKSVASVMPGMPDMSDLGMDEPAESDADGEGAAPAEQPKKKKKFNPFDVVKDVVKDQLP